MNQKHGLWIGLWVLLVVIVGFLAFSHNGIGYAPWHGWGMMGDWDNRYRGYRADVSTPSPGHGMDGSGYGPHMDAPYGMMGGYRGMMGFGPGASYGMSWGLPNGLTPEQLEKIRELQEEVAARNREVVQQMWEAQDRLNSLYKTEHRDWNAIREASRKVLDAKQRLLDANIDLQQKIDGLLTDRQRQEMAQSWRGYSWPPGR